MQLTPAATRYVCPPFERNILRSTGSESAIPRSSGIWRGSELAPERCSFFHSAQEPAFSMKSDFEAPAFD